MRMKTPVIVAVVAAVVAVGGGVAAAAAIGSAGLAPETTASVAAATSESTETPAATSPTATPSDDTAALTAPGAVCDVNSTETVECSVKHPDIGFLNAISRVGAEPLLSMSESAKIAIGHKVCEQLHAGASADSIDVVDTDTASGKSASWNNAIVASAAPFSYCTDLADQKLVGPFLSN